MPEGTFVRLDGLNANTTVKDVEELIMYCGRVFNIVINTDTKSATGYNAIIEFEDKRSVEIAQFISGAVFQGHKICFIPLHSSEIEANTVGSRTQSASLPIRTEDHIPLYIAEESKPNILRLAEKAVEKLQGRCILSNCRHILNGIRDEIKDLDQRLGKASKHAEKLFTSNNFIDTHKGTVEQWDYTPSQPQWGKRPDF